MGLAVINLERPDRIPPEAMSGPQGCKILRRDDRCRVSCPHCRAAWPGPQIHKSAGSSKSEPGTYDHRDDRGPMFRYATSETPTRVADMNFPRPFKRSQPPFGELSFVVASESSPQSRLIDANMISGAPELDLQGNIGHATPWHASRCLRGPADGGDHRNRAPGGSAQFALDAVRRNEILSRLLDPIAPAAGVGVRFSGGSGPTNDARYLYHGTIDRVAHRLRRRLRT